MAQVKICERATLWNKAAEDGRVNFVLRAHQTLSRYQKEAGLGGNPLSVVGIKFH
jgi:hypothetical protein